MEKFNISEFESHKTAGEYNRTLDDGTIINQFGDSNGYFEKVIPSQNWFYTYKEFYGNGNLKLKGSAFKNGDFQSGVWIECDTNGNTVKETNYDEPYKLTIDSVFAILRQNKIPFSAGNKFNLIKRAIVGSGAIWLVEWKVTEGRIERLQIGDATGKINKKDFYLLEEDH